MNVKRYFHSSVRSLRSTAKGPFKLPADPTTTTYRGKLFEWQTQKAFESIGMQLRHIGGRSDGGIDLKGQWTFSLHASGNNSEGNDLSASRTVAPTIHDDSRKPNDLQQQQQQQPVYSDDDDRLIPVVVQCKNVKTGCTPDHLRGLLGATVGLNAARRTLGILASSSPKTFTPDTMALFGASTLPLGLARVTPDAVLEALVLNHTAQQWLDIQILPRFDSFGNPVFPPLMMTGHGRRLMPSSSEEAEEALLLEHQLS
ncbi:hypothetical protein BCR42DRAFT_402884 [Absidia repens]|uniref:Restriction endonuclease type IV Mrr domain-containing protein n=1 Tax=Absidia repens TaxID=90262 RepID=A0A1X2IYK1_9FUNG|nr:hypothetical protein BCR42DRAFT_402884 [Absidia repens]